MYGLGALLKNLTSGHSLLDLLAMPVSLEACVKVAELKPSSKATAKGNSVAATIFAGEAVNETLALGLGHR